jgi:HlyD family secretion protein
MKGGKGKKSEKVIAEAAASRTIIETVVANGKIYPVEEIKISSDVSGTLVEVYVKEGDSVKIGQLLARVNPDQLQTIVERAEASTNAVKAQVGTLSAQLDQAMVQVGNAKNIFDRNKQLFRDGVIAQVELDASETTYRSALANIESIKKNITGAEFNVRSSEAATKEQKVNLGRTSIYAPMSGIVTTISRKKGEQVVGTIQMAGTEIMRIANLNALEVRVDVSENDILRVHKGDTAFVEVDAYRNRKFKGVVTHISNSATGLDNGLATTISSDKLTNFVVKVLLSPESYHDLLKGGRSPFLPGMSASADIRTKTISNAMCVPIQGVTTRADEKNKTIKEKTENEKEVVFVIQGDSVNMVYVTTGAQDESYIQVLTGLAGGEMIVSGPFETVMRKLKQGTIVTKVEKEELFEKK